MCFAIKNETNSNFGMARISLETETSIPNCVYSAAENFEGIENVKEKPLLHDFIR